jgi:muconate cycloisomerase
VARDLERAQSIRQAIGGGVQISADANQGYSREDALDFVQGADETVLDFFEQPVAGHDLAGMQAIARASRVPIGADEGIHSLADIERHAAMKAAQGVSLKTIKLGGVSGVAEAARKTDAMGMKVNLAGKIADSSIASAAIAHLAVALPQIDWGVSVTNQYLSQDVTKEPLLVKGGRIAPPDAPGLGIVVDEARVAEFAYSPAI